MLVWRNNVGNLLVLKTGEHQYLRNRSGVAVDTASFTSCGRSARYARGGAKNWNGARGSSIGYKKRWKWLLRRVAKSRYNRSEVLLAICLMENMLRLALKKKNPSRQGVLLISYIFYVLTRLQHLENRAHCAEANLARAVEDIHQLRYFAWSSQQRNWRDYARGTFLVANGKAANAFSKLLELSFER